MPREATTATAEGQPSEATRRRRRRRRGRRIGMAPGEALPVAAPVPAGVPAARSDTHTPPQPTGEAIAQDTAGAAAPFEYAMEVDQGPRESALPTSPPLPPPQAPDERAAPEPLAEQPDADRTEY